MLARPIISDFFLRFAFLGGLKKYEVYIDTNVSFQVKPYVIEVLDSSIIKVINAALAKLPPFPALP